MFRLMPQPNAPHRQNPDYVAHTLESMSRAIARLSATPNESRVSLLKLVDEMETRKPLSDIYGGHISRYARNSPPTPARRWEIPHLLPEDFATDQEELPVGPYPLFRQVPEDPRTAVAEYPCEPSDTSKHQLPSGRQNRLVQILRYG